MHFETYTVNIPDSHSCVFAAVTSGEYCDFENFEANCKAGYNLHVVQAIYGHMKLGKCITRDLGVFGCQTDVSDILSKHCNQQNQCSIYVHDEKLRSTTPCDRGITVYLDAIHACIQGEIFIPTNRPLSLSMTNDPNSEHFEV